jgi:hypothetical protein|tara:strand:+ start:2089 stop:2361 length:273 start_codon:yes stop_codon:yes gene_type:complete
MAIKEQNTEKLTTEEVTKLNELRITSSELTFERGQVGIAEDNLKRQLNSLAEKFNDLYTDEKEVSKGLFDKYGKGEINLEEGIFIKSTEE